MSFDADKLLRAMAELPLGPVRLMEVCGTHTMAIAKAGIKSVLPQNVTLLSGPGCPVCVTPAEQIDAVLELAMEPEVILTSYGDMLRVPGSRPGDSLLPRARRGGGDRLRPGGRGGARQTKPRQAGGVSRCRL